MSLRSLPNEFYGDNTRWFIGVVVNNKDPLKSGRVQVRIRGIHTPDVSDIPTRDLPWAQVVVPSTEGGISGIGKMANIQNGAQVFGFFVDGPASQIPLVVGSIHNIETNTYKDALNPFTKTGFNKRIRQANNNFNANAITPKAAYFAPGATQLLGGSNGEKIYNFFLVNGYTPEQASAFVGNFAAESSLDPEALNPNDNGERSFGIAQWRADRLSALKSYCAANGLNNKELSAQLQFVIHELNTSEQTANGAIKNAKTLSTAVSAVERKYERAAPGTYERRFSFARDALERYLA